MQGQSLHDLAQDMANVLGASIDEVHRHIDAGDLIMAKGELPPGFLPIFKTVTGRKISANYQVRYRYTEYGDQLAKMRAERESGRGNFFHILDVLRRADDPTLSPEKLPRLQPEKVYGHDTIIRPYMGSWMRIRADMCAIPLLRFATSLNAADSCRIGCGS